MNEDRIIQVLECGCGWTQDDRSSAGYLWRYCDRHREEGLRGGACAGASSHWGEERVLQLERQLLETKTHLAKTFETGLEMAESSLKMIQDFVLLRDTATAFEKEIIRLRERIVQLEKKIAAVAALKN